MAITYRDQLNRDLTPAEVDANFRTLEAVGQANSIPRQLRFGFAAPGGGGGGAEYTQFFDAQLAGAYGSLQTSGAISNVKITRTATGVVIFNGPPSSWNQNSFNADLNTSYTFTFQVSDVTVPGSAIFI